jgi:hypothetical protein
MTWIVVAGLLLAGFGVGWVIGQVVLMLRDDGRYDLWWDDDE